ncbi:MAG: glycosyltransferase family 39 protein [Betaproteobacteria bacterium]|nr:glycosyltransferase family 39 protein [Betaproteobacteria bacterium]
MSSSVSAARPSWRELAALTLLPAILLLLNLGSAPLFDVDEGAFSEATREMLERGDFVSTWLNGMPRFDKPILIYWLQALSVSLFGVNEWSFRLPSALAAIVWCVAVGRFAWPRFGREAAQLATLVGATSLGVFVIGRAATADSLLNCLLTLAMTDAWRHLESGRKAPLRRMFLWIGLGVLTKGPIAIAIPAIVTLLFCATRGEWRRFLRAAFDPLGWLILLAVAAPWYIAALMIHGQAFIDGFIMKHNVGRFSGPMEGHGGSLFYYLLIVPLLLLPWTTLLLRALGEIRAGSAQPLQRFLWIWFGFVLVFFSFSGTKLPHYALYGCTPLFLLIALHRDKIKREWLAFLPPLLLLAFLAALPKLLEYALASGRVTDPYYMAQLARVVEIGGKAYAAISVAALIAAISLTFWRSEPVWRRLSFIAAIQAVLLASLVTPFVGELLQGPVKRAALVAREVGGPAVQWNFFQPSFAVYRGQSAPMREPLPGELALTRFDRLPPDIPVETLFAEGGVRLVRRLP